jgi:hypothetical protein
LLFDDAESVEYGIELAQRSIAVSDRHRLLDVICGNAGAIAPLLWLMKLPGGEVFCRSVSDADESTIEASAHTSR